MHILSLEKTHLRPKLKKKNHDLLSSIVNEIGRTDKGQVRESQNITSRFPTVLLSSLMMFYSYRGLLGKPNILGVNVKGHCVGF